MKVRHQHSTNVDKNMHTFCQHPEKTIYIYIQDEPVIWSAVQQNSSCGNFHINLKQNRIVALGDDK